MREKLVLFLFILFPLAVSSQEYSYEISEYNVSIELYEDRVHEMIEITLKNYQNIETFQYSFIYPLENIKVFDDEGNLEYFIEADSLLCKLNPKGEETYTFVIEFDTTGYISQAKSGKWVFSPIFNFSVPVEHFITTVTIPENMAVISPIYPTPTSFYSSKNSLVITWEKEYIEPGEDVTLLVGYKPTGGEGNNLYLYIGISVGVFVAFLFGLYLSRKTTKAPDVEKYFIGDERIVLELIRKAGGKIRQNDIVSESNFSKAKVSKILSELEKQGLVKKEKFKRTNIVTLKV
ncbi:MAG: helix-turn-helix transcriptional regulator [Candidatus Methanofastidiosia archaeon]